MKKSFLSLVLIGACGATMAQRTVGGAAHMHMLALGSDRTPTDTIYPASIDDPAATFVLYNSQNGGWVVGTNGYGDEAKVQQFLLDDAVSAEAVGVWFGGKFEGSGDPNSHVAFKMYQNNGGGVSTAGTITTGAPNDEWASVDVPFSDCDTSSSFTLTWGTFSAPVWVTDFFAAGVDLTGLTAGDSIGIVSTDDGFSEYQDFSWERWNDGSWHTMLEPQNWALNIDFMVFVAVDASNVGIDDAGTMNGMRMSFLNGNLVGQDLQMAYTIDHSASMQLMVFDASGRRILNKQLGTKGIGLYNETIDASSWSAGTYHVALVADGRTLTKKVVKQ